MASPQRKFSAEADLPPAPQPPNQKGSVESAERRRGWRLGYALILFLLILGFWYVGFGWGDSGGWIWGHGNAAGPIANDGDLSGNGVAILEVANKQDYVGQSFKIRNVAVDHWSSPRAVWIGARHSYLPILLILSSASPMAPASSEPVSISSGGSSAGSGTAASVKHLDVTGTVTKAPPTAQAQRQWHLSDDDVNQLEEEGVYIQATTVQPAKH